MREGFPPHHPGGVADRTLPRDTLTVSAALLPFHADVFPIRAAGLPHPRFLAGQPADDLAADEVSAVLPRRMGSRPAGKGEISNPQPDDKL